MIPARELALLAALVAACAPPSPSPPTGRLVILISLDTLRADHLGAYGYDRPISPNIDALARRGVVFADASSTAPWTLPAHASILTGRYPSRHGVLFDDRRLPDDVQTLAELLSSHGIQTAAAVNSMALSPVHGLDRGFGRFLYVPEDPDECSPTTAMTDKLLSWVDETRGDAFLFLHDFDIHATYCALPAYEAAVMRPYDGILSGTTGGLRFVNLGVAPLRPVDIEHFIDQYDGGIFQTDDEVGRLLVNLEARGLRSTTTVIVVSDHGEAFYEHGHFRHSKTQYQELLHVPLVVAGPSVPAGLRLDAPVSLVDIAPTIAALFDVRWPTGADGIDLGPAWRGQALSPRTLFAQANGTLHEIDPLTRQRPLGRPGNDLWMARRGNDKLILDRYYERRELYALDRDPHETQDLSTSAPGLANELTRALELLERATPARAGRILLSDEELERLEALGYVR